MCAKNPNLIPDFKAAIFDMDGTVLDSMPYWYNIGDMYLEKLGIKPEPGLGAIMQPMGLSEGAQYLRNNYGVNKTDEQIIEGIRETVLDSFKFHIQPKPHVIEFLEELKKAGIPMALATATDENMFSPAFKRLGLFRFFDHILTCSQYKTTKNEPLLFLKAAELLNSKPEEIFVFEDAAHAITTAFKAGFKTAGIQDDSAEQEKEKVKANSTIYFNNYIEAKEYFFGL